MGTSSGGEASYRGEVQPSKREAKRSATEAALRDHLLPVPPPQSLAARSGAGDAEVGVAPTRTDNPVGCLQEQLQGSLGRPVTKGDITYTLVCDEHGLYVASVALPHLSANPSFAGPPRASKQEARHAVAAVALPEVTALLGQMPPRRAAKQTGAEGTIVDASPSVHQSPVSRLQEWVQKVMRRPSMLSDILYTIETQPDGSFLARVEIAVIEGCPPCTGTPCAGKRDAKRSAAESALSNSDVEAQLNSVASASAAARAPPALRSTQPLQLMPPLMPPLQSVQAPPFYGLQAPSETLCSEII